MLEHIYRLSFTGVLLPGPLSSGCLGAYPIATREWILWVQNKLVMACDECTSGDSRADEANAVALFSAESLSLKIGAKRAFEIFGLA